jgi:hypothetical protein
VWWHGIGVFAILAAFLVFVDVAPDASLTWSLVATLGLAFLVGGVLVLQFLAHPTRRDRRPLGAGVVLLVASVLLLPISLALQSSATTAEAIVVPFDPTIRYANVHASLEAGRITVSFVDSQAYLVRADVVHVGGIFASHTEGDVTHTTTFAGDTVEVRVSAQGIPGLFFLGGHEVHLSIQRNLSVALALLGTTADIAVELAEDVPVRVVTASITTGDVRVTGREAAFMNGATVHAVVSTTGSATIDLVQTSGGPGTVSVFASSTAGRVALGLAVDADVGAEVFASTSTGPLSFDATKYEASGGLFYAPSRAGFDAASLKFTVQLTSATGSIAVG